MSLDLPVMRISAATAALRIRENQLDVLQKKLDDIVVNFNYPVGIPELLRCIQAALTKRQGGIPADTVEHINIQQDVNVLEALITHMTLNHETDGLIQRAEKLEDLKIAISKIELTG